MASHSARAAAWLIGGLFVFSAIMLTLQPTRAASSASSWDGYLPADSTALNQTMSTKYTDTYGDGIYLSANAYSLQLSGAPGDIWDLTLAVTASANTREKL